MTHDAQPPASMTTARKAWAVIYGQWCPVCQLWVKDRLSAEHRATTIHVRGLMGRTEFRC